MEETTLRKQRGRKAFKKERPVEIKARKWDVTEIHEYLKLLINFGLNVKRIWEGSKM